MSKRNLPPNTNVINEDAGARMIAPAALRNVDALCDLMGDLAPASGKALEIASGTGQHVTAFASRLPGLNWQPTEIDPDRRASIDAYATGQTNIAKAMELNAVVPGWCRRFGGVDLVVLINLLHLISWPETEVLIDEAAKALNPNGRFILYGPFMRDGALTSAGDERFHSALIEQDPDIGYKNDVDIIDQLARSGLRVLDTVNMPANNLAFVAENKTRG